MADIEVLMRGIATPGDQPLFFNLSNSDDERRLRHLIEQGGVRRISDDYEEQQRELYATYNPSVVYTSDFEKKFQAHYKNLEPHPQHGQWVYFPWISTLTHILPESDYIRVRTARNRNLVTEKEQQRFYNATIGIAGLSVGSNIAYAIALSGGGRHMRLADMDRLALSNTNRILAGAPDLGTRKVTMAAQRIYEINPYARIELYPEGLKQETVENFFKGLSIVVDELDNLAVKYLIREHAQKNKIAVVMAADNGDNGVVDIERYDLDPQPPFFHGRLGNVTYDELASLDKFGIGRTITKHIGPENVTIRMQESLLEMGKSIVSWPQLGIAALTNGAAVAYCIRRILNEQSLEPNRAYISLDEMFVPEYNAPAQRQKRATAAASFKKIFGLDHDA